MINSVLKHFKAIDDWFFATIPHPYSLCPGRETCSTFESIGIQLSSHLHDDRVLTETATQLYRVIQAQWENFPENLFWDFEYMVFNIATSACHSSKGEIAYLAEFADKFVLLQEIFGNKSPIRFRYSHDFMYGYDWMKWVNKDIPNHQSIKPFDLPFLDYIIGRGYEIHALITQNDAKYPRIKPYDYRNPFTFSRDPEDEHILFSRLAQNHELPLSAWDMHAIPRWDISLYQIRKDRADEIGLHRSM